MRSRLWRCRGLAVVVLVTFSQVTITVLAQERVVGYLEYQGRGERREGGGDLSSHLATLRVDGNTYIRAPWIADLSGGIGFSVRQVRLESAAHEGTDITGSARLRVFPRSKFPLEIFADRTDSQVSGELVGPDFRQTVVGLTQNFAPSVGQRYVATVRHTERDDERRDLGGITTHTSNNFASLGMNQTFVRQQFDVRADYDELQRDQPYRSDTRLVGLLRHRYGARDTVNVDSLASMTDSDIDELTGATRNRLLQGNSNLFWRPATTKPTLVTASFLVNSQDITASTGSELALETAVASAGATHQYTPSVALRAAVNATQVRSADAEQHSTLTRLGVTYSPREVPVGRFYYRHSLNADFGHRADDVRGTLQELSGALSHGLTISRGDQEGSRSASATQLVTGLADSEDRSQTNLTHSVSLDWSRYGAGDYLSARGVASDTRRQDSLLGDTAFQLINLQVNGRLIVSRYASWQGNLTVQTSHNDATVLRSPWVTSTSANVTYQRDRLFGVPLLRFTSEFRALSDDLANATQDRFILERRARWSWTNRLDYTVGRMQLSLRGAVGEVDGRRQTLVYLQVRRFFGQPAR